MKKRLLIIALLMALIFTACSPKDVVTEETNNEPKIEDTACQFYKDMYTSNSRPIALMIDNDNESARPQIGIEDAYITYEIIVEGGSTRFMALFKGNLPEKVGPVRSSRHYFLDYALENDAIYAHAGWSPKAANDIKTLGVNNINGIIGDDGVNYWRDNTYDNSWHNLYTSIKKLSDHAKNKKNYRMETEQKPLIEYYTNDSELTGTETNAVNVSYSPYYKVSLKYNFETNNYERYINSKPHTSQTGNILGFKNVIVYQVENFDLPDTENKGRQDIRNIGSGTGYYLSNGVRQDIKWEKTDRNSKTKYTLASDGSELKINPGNTMIQIAPKTYEITFE